MNPADAESTYQLGVLYDRNGRTRGGRETAPPRDHAAGELSGSALSTRAHRAGAQGLQDRAGGAGAGAQTAARPGGDPHGPRPRVPGAGARFGGEGGVCGGAATEGGGDRARPAARRIGRADEAVIRREWACLALVCAVAAAQGIATRNVKPAAREKASGRPWPSRLTNIARQAGLTRPTVYGAESNVQYLVETSAGGVALFDYDGDGWTDIFVVSGTRFEDAPPEATNRLYRNNHDGSFHGRDGAGGAAAHRLGARGRGRRLRQRRAAGPVRHLLGRERALSQQRRRHVLGRGRALPAWPANRAAAIRSGTPARPSWITIATGGWISSWRLTRITTFAACPSRARIPTATGRASRRRAVRGGCVPGGHSLFRQSRGRNVRRRVGEVGNREIAVVIRLHGHGGGFRRRRLAGYLSGVRLDSLAVLSQQRKRHIHRGRARTRPGAESGRDGAGGDGAGSGEPDGERDFRHVEDALRR